MLRRQMSNNRTPDRFRVTHSRQKSLNRFGASAVYTAVPVIDRWPSQRRAAPDVGGTSWGSGTSSGDDRTPSVLKGSSRLTSDIGPRFLRALF
jgi:hypothetical protein